MITAEVFKNTAASAIIIKLQELMRIYGMSDTECNIISNDHGLQGPLEIYASITVAAFTAEATKHIAVFQ